MIQEIRPRRFHNEFPAPGKGKEGLVVHVRGGEVLARSEDGQISLPTTRESCADPDSLVYLFSIDDVPFYLGHPGPASEALEAQGLAWRRLRGLEHPAPKWIHFACGVAMHLGHWYEASQFCGRCGAPMEPKTDERAMRCPECGNTVYPTIAPAVIVGVVHGDRILVTRYAGPGGSGYALVAGFVEIGESAEDTVRREVMEEVGVRVRHIRYYKSQPWPFTSALMLGFFCELDGDEEITLDESELSEALWADRASVPVVDDGISLTYEMMRLFRNGADVLG